ncbi:hypothetical protein DRO97_06030 [Archaeoglobales archaeon]|nr:MAG: hypothetical protein DRO97_06030 [Archaeoglobales archaeon]
MYMNLSAVLKPSEKKERSLRLYPKYRFDIIYNKFDEHKRKQFEMPFTRREWKNVIKMLDEINKTVWRIASLRRNNSFNKRRIEMFHSIIFRLSLQIRELHETLLALIAEEEVVWKNYLFNLNNTVLKSKLKIAITKDDVHELSPTAKIMSLKLTLRQIFIPVQQLLDSIEAELLNGEVDEGKLRQLEDAMLLRVLPWFFKVFRRCVENV